MQWCRLQNSAASLEEKNQRPQYSEFLLLPGLGKSGSKLGAGLNRPTQNYGRLARLRETQPWPEGVG